MKHQHTFHIVSFILDVHVVVRLILLSLSAGSELGCSGLTASWFQEILCGSQSSRVFVLSAPCCSYKLTAAG